MTGTLTHGADVDRLREIAQALAALADEVDSVEASGRSGIAVLLDTWLGADLVSFEGSWGYAAGWLAAASSHLDVFAKLLLEQAQQQDDASQGGGPPGEPRPVGSGLSHIPQQDRPGRPAWDRGRHEPWVNGPLLAQVGDPDQPALEEPGSDGKWLRPWADDALAKGSDWWRLNVVATDPGTWALDRMDDAAEFVDSVPDRMGLLKYLPRLAPAAFFGYPALADEIRSMRSFVEDPKGYLDEEMSTPLGQLSMASVFLGPVGRLGTRNVRRGFEEVEEALRRFRRDPVKKVGSYEVPDGAVFVDSGRKGDWNKALHRPEPSSTYVVDDKFVYTTDEHGRVKEARGVLELGPSDRNTYQQRKAGGDDRLMFDQGGHIFAAELGGPGEGINLLAMSRKANLSEYRAMERDIKAALQENPPPKIEAVVQPIFDGDSERPSQFVVRWTKNGKNQRRVEIEND